MECLTSFLWLPAGAAAVADRPVDNENAFASLCDDNFLLVAPFKAPHNINRKRHGYTSPSPGSGELPDASLF